MASREAARQPSPRIQRRPSARQSSRPRPSPLSARRAASGNWHGRTLRPEPRHAAPAVAGGCRVVHWHGAQHRRWPGLRGGLAAFLLPHPAVRPACAPRAACPRLSIPSAVGPHTSGAGFWPRFKVERPTGRTTLTGGQVPARLRPADGRRDGQAFHHHYPYLPALSFHPGARGPRRRLAADILILSLDHNSVVGAWIGAYVVFLIRRSTRASRCRCGGATVSSCRQPVIRLTLSAWTIAA